jgi:hypothetical protein
VWVGSPSSQTTKQLVWKSPRTNRWIESAITLA